MFRLVTRLGDVYGVSRDLPQNYVARADIDGKLIESLTRDKHIVIFGSSKQGKTSLRKWNLNDDEYIVVTYSNRWNLAELHAAILKASGYSVEQSTTRTITGDAKVKASFTSKLRIGAEVGGDLGAEKDKGHAHSRVTAPLDLDVNDVNDVILALRASALNQYIVLEDFHYLPEDTQRNFAFALKAFHESSDFTFVIVGVWLDENRLIQYNGDLSGRVIAVDADAWSEGELRAVIEKGGALLEVDFDERFVRELLDSCFDSVWVVQEVCYRLCDLEGLLDDSHARVSLGKGASAHELAREVVDTQSARYNGFFRKFSEGFMQTALQMYRWLLLPVIATEPRLLEAGLAYGDIRRLIDRYHPSGPINPGNLTQALNSTASLQTKLDIKPIVLDDNQTRRRLEVMDRSFLIWLQHQESDALLSSAGLPVPLRARR